MLGNMLQMFYTAHFIIVGAKRMEAAKKYSNFAGKVPAAKEFVGYWRQWEAIFIVTWYDVNVLNLRI